MQEILLSKLATQQNIDSLIGFDTYLIEDQDGLHWDSEVIIRGFHEDYGAICEITNIVIYDYDGEYDECAVEDFYSWELHRCDGFFEKSIGFYVSLNNLHLPQAELPNEILLKDMSHSKEQRPRSHSRRIISMELFNKGSLFT